MASDSQYQYPTKEIKEQPAPLTKQETPSERLHRLTQHWPEKAEPGRLDRIRKQINERRGQK